MVVDALGNIYSGTSQGTFTPTFIGNIPNAISATQTGWAGAGAFFILDTSGNVHYSVGTTNSFSIVANIPDAIGFGYNSVGALVILDSLGNIFTNPDSAHASFTNVCNIPNAVSIFASYYGMAVMNSSGIVYSLSGNINARTTLTATEIFTISGLTSPSPTLDVKINGSTPLSIQSGLQNTPAVTGVYTTEVNKFVSSANSGIVEVVVGNNPASGSAKVLIEYVDTFLS